MVTANEVGRAGRLSGVAVVLLATLALAAPSRAGAATVTSLQARADAIASRVEADQGQLLTIGTQYVEEQAALVTARNQEAATEAAVSLDARQVDADRAAVRSSAVAAYVEAGTASVLALYLAKGTAVGATGSTYLNAASGLLDRKISLLDGDEHRLDVLDATARNEATAISSSLSRLASDRAGAIATLAEERSALASARGQLAALVAARAAAAALAAERAAAAAAQREAAAQAAAAAAAANSPGATTSAPTSSESAGPPSLNAVLTAAPSAIPPGSLSADFAGIRNCESSDDYSLNTGNGYYGAYQFSASTWAELGGVGLASAAPPATQDAAAYRLYQQDGFAAWPECAAILGL